jgi:group I intron endonuclease
MQIKKAAAFSGVYAFRNKLNGKVYVGQSQNVKTRRIQHERGDTSNSRRFHNAMQKYGAERFDWVVLEYCQIEQLNEREAYWVQKLDSLHPNGYNLTSGGGAFQKHHAETRLKFSENQKKLVESNEHHFQSPEFIEKQTRHQIELGIRGEHSSQRKDVKAKRNQTVQDRIASNGKFFSHTPEEIERKRQHQIELYANGEGKFTQPEFIENNIAIVKKKLENGTHHTQQEGWVEKSRVAHQHEMKAIVLAIRKFDGSTVECKFDSVHAAALELEAHRNHISSICKSNTSAISVKCSLGKVIKGIFGNHAGWDLEKLKHIPDTAFTNQKAVTVTIQTDDGKIIIKSYQGQREACRDLGAQPRALRYMIKGEKYKSTGCHLGRIINVQLS